MILVPALQGPTNSPSDLPLNDTATVSLVAKEGGGIIGQESDAIELRQLVPQEKDSCQDKYRSEGRQQKSERKFRELQEEEIMKFSHSVQFNAVPEWSSHYISYSNLKKL